MRETISVVHVCSGDYYDLGAPPTNCLRRAAGRRASLPPTHARR